MGAERGQGSVEYAALLALVLVALTVAGPPVVDAAREVTARLATARPDRRVVVERLVDAPLDAFLRQRASPGRDGRLDWTTDGCSAPVVGSRGLTFDFHAACLRHDFGYRNLKALGLLDAPRRRHVDAVFLTDMQASCATRRRRTVRRQCLRWARLFHAAVRRFG